jgi:hypothetical protein
LSVHSLIRLTSNKLKIITCSFSVTQRDTKFAFWVVESQRLFLRQFRSLLRLQFPAKKVFRLISCRVYFSTKQFLILIVKFIFNMMQKLSSTEVRISEFLKCLKIILLTQSSGSAGSSNTPPPPQPKAQRRSVFATITDTISKVFSSEEPAEPAFNISSPYNFKHTHHVQADPHSSTGFAVMFLINYFSRPKQFSL